MRGKREKETLGTNVSRECNANFLFVQKICQKEISAMYESIIWRVFISGYNLTSPV